jgi:hypothetical protein
LFHPPAAEFADRPAALDLPAPWPVRVPGVKRNIVVKIAACADEWEQAYRLVGTNYQARGYEPTTSSGLRFTAYNALPDSVTFVAKHEGKVMVTLSVVMDNTVLGLPMESVFHAEVDQLRRAGRRVVEVTGLADTELSPREFIAVFVALMRLMTQYAVTQDGDALVITINPRHRDFYRKVLGFVPLGQCRAYPSVQNNPAEAYLLQLDMDQLRVNTPKMYQQVFGEWLPAEALRAPRMPAYLVRHFASRSSHTDLAAVDEILDLVGHFGSMRQWL